MVMRKKTYTKFETTPKQMVIAEHNNVIYYSIIRDGVDKQKALIEIGNNIYQDARNAEKHSCVMGELKIQQEQNTVLIKFWGWDMQENGETRNFENNYIIYVKEADAKFCSSSEIPM